MGKYRNLGIQIPLTAFDWRKSTMSNKPIFVATHPRACSTAFERVFMTRRDTLQCVHEPFGDAYYFGPERLAERYEDDEKSRFESGYSESTYRTIFDRIAKENTEVRASPSVIDASSSFMSFPSLLAFISTHIQSSFSFHTSSHSSL